MNNALAHLKSNPRISKEKATKYRQQLPPSYKNRPAKIANLHYRNFLSYLDIDPDTILDYIDHNIFNKAKISLSKDDNLANQKHLIFPELYSLVLMPVSHMIHNNHTSWPPIHTS